MIRAAPGSHPGWATSDRPNNVDRSDDFNTVAAVELRNQLGHTHVFRIARDPDAPDLLPPPREIGILGSSLLTFAEFERQIAAGARIVSHPGVTPTANNADAGNAGIPLFAIRTTGRLSVACDGRPLDVQPGDTVISLELVEAHGRGAPDAAASSDRSRRPTS